ncbi:MAG: HAD hydrolase-like protein [Clostridia bacterium]|nr:HAD hydrolase-like protein [Clostridia bacterium]
MSGIKKRLIIMTDIGDTVIDEGTEQRDAAGVVTRADCIPGARETYLALHQAGFSIVMVADGLVRSFHNTMEQHGLDGIFSAWIISEEVGEDKPSPRMFAAAMKAMGLTDQDKSRIIMVGNNVLRDIRGANRFGLHSVLIDWSKRRPFDEELPEDHAEYRIHRPEELLPLAEKLERELS